MLQGCKILQDKNKKYFVQCGSVGEKEKTKNNKPGSKGSSSPGENKKRPSSQVSKTIGFSIFLEEFECSTNLKIKRAYVYYQLRLEYDANLEK